MTKEQIKKIEEVVSKREFEAQLERAIEEASEFILAAQKMKRYPGDTDRNCNLIEETGDLLIMMEQMRLYLGDLAVDKSINFKLNRELKRLRNQEAVLKFKIGQKYLVKMLNKKYGNIIEIIGITAESDDDFLIYYKTIRGENKSQTCFMIGSKFEENLELIEDVGQPESESEESVEEESNG